MRLDDVCPAGAVYDPADIAPLNAECVSYRLVSFAKSSAVTNFADKVIAQYGSVMALTFLSAMPTHVSVIRGGSIPSKLAQAVIAGVAIFMATLHAGWARANKRQQDKTVNVDGMKLSIPSLYTNNLPSIFIVTPGAQLSPIRITPAAVVTRPYGAISPGAVARAVWYWLTPGWQRWNVHGLSLLSIHTTYGPTEQP